MALQLISLPLYFEWVISSMYPLQTPYLPFYGSTYFKFIDNIHNFEQEAEYALNLLNHFNIQVIYGHNQYFQIKLDDIDPLTGRRLYSSVSQHYLSTTQIETFDKFITSASAYLRDSIHTLGNTRDVIRLTMNNVSNLFNVRNEVILNYSRSLNCITKAISNLDFFDTKVVKSHCFKEHGNSRKLLEVLHSSDIAQYNNFIKRYENSLFNLKGRLEYGMNLIETKTNPIVNEPSTNPWVKLGTAILTITPFIVVYFAAGNLGYEMPSWLWKWLK